MKKINKELIIPHIEESVIFEKQLNKIISNSKPAEKEAEELGWVVKISEGQYVLTEKMAQLFIAFMTEARKFSSKLNYQEWIFPRLQTKEAITNFGWFDIPQLRPELLAVKPFENDGNRLHEEWYLDPLQCPSFYRFLKTKSPLSIKDLPLKVHEWRGGWTYRNETKERISSGFGTALEFSGLELVYTGIEEDVKEIRFITMLEVLSFIEKLELDYRLVIGSSCSHEKEGTCPKGETIRIYDIPTIDIEVYIPQEDSYIEIGGADFIGTRIINRFNIKTQEGIQLYSGCQGIGWQRLSKAFLSQKGFDISNMPHVIAKYYK